MIYVEVQPHFFLFSEPFFQILSKLASNTSFRADICGDFWHQIGCSYSDYNKYNKYLIFVGGDNASLYIVSH